MSLLNTKLGLLVLKEILNFGYIQRTYPGADDDDLVIFIPVVRVY